GYGQWLPTSPAARGRCPRARRLAPSPLSPPGWRSVRHRTRACPGRALRPPPHRADTGISFAIPPLVLGNHPVVEPASLRSTASRRRVLRAPALRGVLCAGPGRLPFLQEGAHSLLGVTCHRVLGHGLRHQPIGLVLPSVDLLIERVLADAERERARRGDLGGELQCRAVELACRHYPV